MKNDKIYGYTLIELGITLTLTGILLICFFKIRAAQTHSANEKNYLSYFLPLEILLKKSDAVSWDGTTLTIRYLSKDRGIMLEKEGKYFLHKTQYIKITSKRESHKPHTLNIVLPEVYTIDWFFWNKQNHQWEVLKPTLVYSQKIFRVVLLGKNHCILEQFIF